jgi:hypothetical protein
VFRAWIAHFSITTVELTIKEEGDEEKRKTVEKITRKEGPGLRRLACSLPCGTSPHTAVGKNQPFMCKVMIFPL